MNQEQFSEWRNQEHTKEVFKEIAEVRDQLKDQLANGATLGSEVETARVVGSIEGLNQLLNISFDGGDE